MPCAVDLPAHFLQLEAADAVEIHDYRSGGGASEEKILQGHWPDFLPGRNRLAVELGVSHMTVSRAVEQLEDEGLIVSQGHGRPRRIVLPESGRKSRGLRIAVLLYEAEDTKLFYVVDFVHRLREAGHQVDYSEASGSFNRISLPPESDYGLGRSMNQR